MSTYTEQEELEKLKAWWKNYGTALIFGVVLGAALLVGIRYWNHTKEQGLEAAAGLYEQMLLDQRAQKLDAVRLTGDTLIKDYASTPYAEMAALVLAKIAHESGNEVGARQHLQWVIDHAKGGVGVHAARLRLARLHVARGEMEPALALLDVKDQQGFESEYQEVKGDIFAAQGRRNEARAAYREALKLLRPDSTYAPILSMKLDDLGPEKTS